jgi:glycosyltransferase involved in cell wall biosynthesis
MNKETTKIIIVSYYFDPANFVAVERIKYWAENFHQHGIFPIIITRNWDENQSDIFNSKKSEKIHLKFPTHEVIYLPVREFGMGPFYQAGIGILVRKMLSAFKLILENFSLKIHRNDYFFQECHELMKQCGIRTVIISGAPFHHFQIGYQLKKKFKNLNWYADYRDEWSSHKQFKSLGIFAKIIYRLNKHSEKKWLSNAEGFITVSEEWRKAIAQLIKINGITIKNGFTTCKPLDRKVENNYINLIFAGRRYPQQPLQKMIELVKNFNSKSTKYNIKLNFIGSQLPKNYEHQLIKDLSSNIDFKDRIPKEELLEIYKKMDAGIILSFEGKKGWYPVKVFDYFTHGLPIILFFNDQNVIERFINDSKSGFIVDNEFDLEIALEKLIKMKADAQVFINQIDHEKAKEYSRGEQLKKLSTFIQTNNTSNNQ